jgi:hypothetical protein
MTWDPSPVNELPDAGWTPVYSTVDHSLIGWTVPISATYSLTYDVSIATTVAVGILFVNGQMLLRSLSTLVSDTDGSQVGFNKTFLVNLQQGDILSIVLLNLSGAGLVPPVATGMPSRYVQTLTADLRDASSSSDDTGADATQPPMTPSLATNVEQWAASPCVQLAITNAQTCAQSTSNPTTQLACIDTLIAALAACGSI